MTDKVIATVSEVLNVEVNTHTTQKNCAKWDSLTHINLIIALEDAFEISFEPEEIARMTSIIAIKQIIDNKTHPSK